MKDTNTINVDDDGKVMYWIEYIFSQIGAVVNDHDITKVMANDQTMKSYIAKGYYDANDDTVTFPQETVTYVYNYIQDHSDEWIPFYIMDTIRAKSVLASIFASKEMYQEFLDYTSSHRITAFNSHGNVSSGYMLLGDVTPIIKGGGGFVLKSNIKDIKKVNYVNTYTLNGDWLKENVKYDRYDYVFTDGAYSVDILENHGVFDWYNFYINNYPPILNGSVFGNIITEDGGRMRVFKSQAEFAEYKADQRKVYFGKDFYNYTSADITAKWDDISDTLDYMDDILQQLLDKINDSTDESTIEELLQEILDAIKNGGGGGGGVVVGPDMSAIEVLLQEILDAIRNAGGGGIGGGIGGTVSQWYQDILDYLDKILKQLKSIKRWTVIDTFIDGVDAIADWLDLIHDILSDVDDGAESAVATLSDALDDATGLLKSKFPFSVPWDIFFFVTLLAADPETPYFEVPIDFDVSAISMHIHYDFVVDFSDYKYLSDICRVVLSMTYAVGLMKMTAGIVNTKKEE
ncbi:MAG: hypothetical protein HDR28_02500 [Lachnospiraceae bacterium]|nr:hypothetical protein [Lachnospiraceae bacterium]